MNLQQLSQDKSTPLTLSSLPNENAIYLYCFPHSESEIYAWFERRRLWPITSRFYLLLNTRQTETIGLLGIEAISARCHKSRKISLHDSHALHVWWLKHGLAMAAGIRRWQQSALKQSIDVLSEHAAEFGWKHVENNKNCVDRLPSAERFSLAS